MPGSLFHSLTLRAAARSMAQREVCNGAGAHKRQVRIDEQEIHPNVALARTVARNVHTLIGDIPDLRKLVLGRSRS